MRASLSGLFRKLRLQLTRNVPALNRDLFAIFTDFLKNIIFASLISKVNLILSTLSDASILKKSVLFKTQKTQLFLIILGAVHKLRHSNFKI